MLARLLVVLFLLVAGCTAAPDEAPALQDADEEGPASGDAPLASDAPVSSPAKPAANGTAPQGSDGANATAPPAAPSQEPAPAAQPPPPAPTGAMAAFWRQVETAVAGGATVSLAGTREADLYGLVPTLEPERTFDATLRRSLALAPDAWAEVERGRVPLPPVWAYEGHVAGAEDQLVRLTIADGWARGSVRVGDELYLVRMGLDGNLPAAKAPALSAAAASPRVERDALGRERAMYEDAGHAEQDCLGAVPPYLKPMADLGRTRAAPVTLDVVLDADRALLDQMGSETFPLMVAMMQEVDAIYDHEVGVRLRVVGLHAHSDAERFPSPGSLTAMTSPLGKLSEYWNARLDVPRDFVHLFTGMASDYAQANCIGGMGHPEVAYAFSPMGWEAQPGSFHVRATAHELGHLFAAHHHYGNHAESVGGTLMIQGYTPGDRPVFSTLTKSVIRGWAEEGLG